jgi:hypothetical protein
MRVTFVPIVSNIANMNREDTLRFKKLALGTAAAGCLGLTALSPLPVEASVLQMSRGLSSTVDINIEQVRCWWVKNEYGKRKWRCGEEHREWREDRREDHRGDRHEDRHEGRDRY